METRFARRSLAGALDALQMKVKSMSGPESTKSRGPKVVAQVLVVACVWLMLCAIAMFELGLWPRTAVAWALCVALGPVAYLTGVLALEFAMNVLRGVPWVRRSSDWVERRTAQKRFSWLRIGYALLGPLCLLVVGLMLWVYGESRPQHEPGPVKQFIARHFR